MRATATFRIAPVAAGGAATFKMATGRGELRTRPEMLGWLSKGWCAVAEELEADHETWAGDEIQKAGGLQVKITFPGRRGAPDDIVFWPGAFKDLVEYKRRSGVLSHNQEVVHELLAKFGVTVWLLYTREETLRYISVRRPKRRRA
jgi:hypothetical protein